MRSTSGGIAWSSVATRYHDGNDFQAGTPMTSAKALDANGCCTANMTLDFVGSTSAAKWSVKSSSASHTKPLSSTNWCFKCRGYGALREQTAERLALVESERRNVNQRRYVPGAHGPSAVII